MQNHSCSPSLYIKLLPLDGEPHLVLFAREDIVAGQELTLSYQMEEDNSQSNAICLCGALNCSGRIDQMPDEDEA